MCWFGNLQESNGKIASEDVFVYKVLRMHDSELYSPCRYMVYKLGTSYMIYPNVIEPVKVATASDITHRIDYGLHCYSEECIASKTAFGNLFIDQPNGNYLTTYVTGATSVLALIKCKIPKGAKYYENSFGEIVTEKLETLYRVSVPRYDRLHCKGLKKMDLKAF